MQATKTSLVIKMNKGLLKKTLRNSQICPKGQRTEFRATQPGATQKYLANLVQQTRAPELLDVLEATIHIPATAPLDPDPPATTATSAEKVVVTHSNRNDRNFPNRTEIPCLTDEVGPNPTGHTLCCKALGKQSPHTQLLQMPKARGETWQRLARCHRHALAWQVLS